MNNSLFCYHAFGLNICSQLKLPSLYPVDQINNPDVTIKLGEVSHSGLDKPHKSSPFMQTAKDSLWLHIPDIARFLVSDGNTIIVAPEADADEQSVHLFLLGSCLGAILHQRGMLVLHGNAIRFGDHCVIFAGASGQGKSTLAAAFHQLGHDILTDDVCAIDRDGFVHPGYPQIKLWQDTLTELDIDHGQLNRIRLLSEKYAMPIKNGFSQNPLPLKTVYILRADERDTFEFVEFKGLNKLKPLKNQTYRNGYLEGLQLAANHLQLCGAIADKIDIVRIIRPNRGFQLQQLIEHIKVDVEKRGIRQ